MWFRDSERWGASVRMPRPAKVGEAAMRTIPRRSDSISEPPGRLFFAPSVPFCPSHAQACYMVFGALRCPSSGSLACRDAERGSPPSVTKALACVWFHSLVISPKKSTVCSIGVPMSIG